MEKIKRKYLAVLILAYILCVYLVVPLYAYAQHITPPATSTQEKLPQYGQGVDASIQDYLCTPQGDGHDLERCVNRLYRGVISVGAIIVVFFIVLAGYMYITGGESGKTKGKAMLFNAIIGLVIILTSYMLLYFINPSLVVIKSIQPPIFTVGDLPECDDVGLGKDCIVVEDGPSVTAAKGGYADCPDGLIDFDKKAVPVNAGNDTEKICKALMEKLKQIHQQEKIIVTATIDPTGTQHDSKCHKNGFPVSGVCADMVPSSGNYAKLCTVVKSIGGLAILNETGQTSAECGTSVKTAKGTGAHLHIWLTNGGGGSSTAGGGGSRPYCKPIYKFLCDHPADMAGKNIYPDHQWKSPYPDIQKNLDELKKVCKAETNESQCLGYSIEQVYRPPEYSAHLRSVYEAYALMVGGWSDDKVSHHGQYCNGSIQYVKSTDVKDIKKGSAEYNYIIEHFNAHFGNFGKLDANTTCLSDHGKGIAVDFTSPDEVDQKKLLNAGLCHNIPKGVGSALKPDAPHYVLKSKANTNKCSF